MRRYMAAALVGMALGTAVHGGSHVVRGTGTPAVVHSSVDLGPTDAGHRAAHMDAECLRAYGTRVTVYDRGMERSTSDVCRYYSYLSYEHDGGDIYTFPNWVPYGAAKGA